MNMFAGRAGQSLGANATNVSPEETFAALVERLNGPAGQQNTAGTARPLLIANLDAAPGKPASGKQSELGAMLAQIMEKLTALEETLAGDAEPNSDALGEIADLLAGLGDMPNATELPTPGSAGFEKLSALAANLGLTAGGGTGEATAPLDTLASLATRMSAQIKDLAPELSAKLGDFAAVLDRLAVRIETAAAQNADLPPDTRKAVLLSEVQRSPATAIDEAARAAAQAPKPDAEPKAKAEPDVADLTAQSKRSLARPDNTNPSAHPEQTAPKAQQTAAAAANAAVQAVSADAQATQEGTDTLILPTGQQSSATQATAAARPAQPFAPQQAPINMQYVAAEITRHVQNGVNRFEIRLNPPELGRIDVRMEMDQSGNVVARLAVEKSETLDLMQRDQRALEKALADAGLDSAKTELEFSLRQEGGDADDTSGEAPWRAGESQSDQEPSTQPASAAQTQLYRGYARADAVNLWV